MEIKIEKNVSMPTQNGRTKYPLGVMEIGDSFFLVGRNSQSVSGSFGLLRPKKFSVRTLTENGIKGVRIWRIA